jgi:hypothetical protein
MYRYRILIKGRTVAMHACIMGPDIHSHCCDTRSRAAAGARRRRERAGELTTRGLLDFGRGRTTQRNHVMDRLRQPGQVA